MIYHRWTMMNPLGNRRHFSSVDSIGQDKHVSFRCSCIIIATPAGRIQLHYSAEIVPIRCSLHSRYPLVRVHLSQSESREVVTSGCASVWEGLKGSQERENNSMFVTGSNIAQLAPFKVRIFWWNVMTVMTLFSAWWKMGNSGGEWSRYLRIFFSFFWKSDL